MTNKIEERCCCGKYTCSQDEDVVYNNIQHQMLGKKQGYNPYCGPIYLHELDQLHSDLTDLQKKLDFTETLRSALQHTIWELLDSIDYNIFYCLAHTHKNRVDEAMCSAKFQITEFKKKLETTKQALQKIANPISFMREEAEKNGYKLDGVMAIKLSEDHNYLKEIARQAIEKVE